MLHTETMNDPEFRNSPIRQFLMYVNHATPFLFSWINFSMTDVVVASKHWKGLEILAVIYFYINYRETKAKGTPLYSFLTWEDMPTSLAVCICLNMFFVVLFLSTAYITKMIKRKPSKY